MSVIVINLLILLFVAIFCFWFVMLYRLLPKKEEGLILRIKRVYRLWRNPETRVKRLQDLKESTIGGIVFVVVLFLFFAGLEMFRENADTVFGIGLLGLWGLWKIAKWAFLAMVVYWLVMGLIDFFASRIAYHMKDKC